MIDQWFIEEAMHVLREHKRLVITDMRGEGTFLLNYLPPKRCKVFIVSKEHDELASRIEAERDYRDKNVVFYTTIAKSNLTLLQEYASTCGCIELDDMETYIKHLLYRHLGANSSVDGRTLLLAAKVSKGKDENWWRGVAQGITKPVDPPSLIIGFLSDPEGFAAQNEEEVYNVMQHEACKLTGKPEVKQTPLALAKDFMRSLFNSLLNNTINDNLKNLYYQIVDSESMSEAFDDYISGFNLPSDVNPFKCHYDHPFTKIDKTVFKCYSDMLKHHEDTTLVLRYLSQRLLSKKAKKFKESWLNDFSTVINFDLGEPHAINSLEEFGKYYQEKFSTIDTAMRRLYVEWLSEEDTIRPVQEYYELQNQAMLNSWFLLVKDYKPTQHNLIKNCFDQANSKTVVIVCDGLRLEMAEAITKRRFSNDISIKKDTAWCQLPSVTPNGMSALYGLASVKEDSIFKRHASLKAQLPDVEIMQLSSINSGVTAKHLVLLYGDIDTIGEHKQLAGLADIAAYEKELYNKIKMLLSMGYCNVYLTTDHGYVITGLLDEADKVPAPSGTKTEERFVVSDETIGNTKLIERHDEWLDGNYQYYAQTDKPFRTRGRYGYSHGGFTPQECLIPVYHFSKESSDLDMKVRIENKEDLLAVTGQYYTVRLKGSGSESSIFDSERRVKLLFYDGNNIELNQSQIVRLKANESQSLEFELSHSELKLVVIDAATTEQLDSCIVKKQISRDIEDLF